MIKYEFTYRKIWPKGSREMVEEFAEKYSLFELSSTFAKIEIDYLFETVPSVKNFCDRWSLKPVAARHANYTRKSNAALPHVDYALQNVAFNIPMHNVENCRTVFYKMNPDCKLVKTDHKPSTYYFVLNCESGIYEEYDSFVCDAPTLMNIQIPHKIFMEGDGIRQVMSLRFTKDPWFLLGV